MMPLSRVVERVLLAVLMISGLLLACRTLLGPLRFPVPMNSPINAEGVFGIAAVLLLLLRAAANPSAEITARTTPDQRFNRWDALALVSLAAIVAAAFGRSISDYFVSDDFLILRHAREFASNYQRIFTTGGGDGFFRPLVYLSFAATLPFAQTDPTRWHMVGFALHAINALLVFALARGLGFSRFASWAAAAVFAVHGTRPETVVWITGRFDLLATFFVLLALWLFVFSWSCTPASAMIARILALLAMVAGLLAKESAYACPLLMALLLCFRRESWRTRILVLGPFFVATACLFFYRWSLFGSIGGYLDPSGKPAALSLGIVSVLKALALRLWAILFFPVNWSVAPGAVLGIATIVYVAAVIWLASRGVPRNLLILSLGFLLIAALPPIQQMLIGADLQKSRYLYLPSVGFCLLLAAAAERVPGWWRWTAVLAVLLFNLAALEHNLDRWQYASRKAKSTCIAAATCLQRPSDRMVAAGVPRILDGVYFFQNGFPECVRLERDAAQITVRDTLLPADPAEYDCVLSWDPGKREVKPSVFSP